MKTFKVWHCSALLSYSFLMSAIHFAFDGRVVVSLLHLAVCLMWVDLAWYHYKKGV